MYCLAVLLTMHAPTTLAQREELREYVRRHISQFGLEEQMLPLARALDFLLSGESSFVARLSPEVKGVTQDIISKLQRAGEAQKDAGLEQGSDNQFGLERCGS